jgi:hypothetical protein
MQRNSFTEEEIILCAYAALYDEKEFGGIEGVHRLTKRPTSSVSMKIRNIVAMLDEDNLPRNQSFTPLTGTAQGQPSRRTNWETVEPLTQISRDKLKSYCQRIVTKAASGGA